MQDPFQRQWYITQVLIHGKTEDVRELDWNEIKRLLPELILPEDIRFSGRTTLFVKSKMAA